MKLIIAEKPSLARNIAAAIGASQKRNGYLEGGEYLVTWAFGHLFPFAISRLISPTPSPVPPFVGQWTISRAFRRSSGLSYGTARRETTVWTVNLP